MILYPKIERSSLLENEAAELALLTIDECHNRRKLFDNRAIYNATGGIQASIEHLSDLVEGLTKIASRNGYPNELTKKTAPDSEWGEFLHRNMRISASQASYDGVWQFFTIILVPDLVRWRWGIAKEKGKATDHWITVSHKGRNTFGRLWQRCSVMVSNNFDNPYKYLYELGEDQLIQIMERPSFAGNRRLSQTTASVLLELTSQDLKSIRSSLLRDYQKRMLRIGAFLELQSLDDTALRDLSMEIFKKSIENLSTN